jgi:FkbM family methyltransferase
LKGLWEISQVCCKYRFSIMNLPEWFRQLTYNPFVLNIVRFLRISSLMKYIYYKLYSSNNKVKNLFFDGIEAEFYVNNFEEMRTFETIFEKGDKDEEDILSPLIDMLQPGDIAYDIGANLGIHTIFMAKKVGENGRVIAFEPETTNYEALRQNINLNGLNNITHVKVALGDKVDTGNLYMKKKVGHGAVSLIRSDESNFCEKIEILPGDFLIQDRNLPLPKAVKIDVEGYEYLVIKGLQKTLTNEICQLVCCEIHSNLYPPETKSQMILDLLKSIGFTRIETFNRGSEIHAICYKE